MITLRIKLYKEKPDGLIDDAEPRFHHRNQLLLLEVYDIEDRLNTAFAQIQEALEKWTSNGSEWIVDRVVSMKITISKYQPLRGGSYNRTTKIHKRQKSMHQRKKQRRRLFEVGATFCHFSM